MIIQEQLTNVLSNLLILNVRVHLFLLGVNNFCVNERLHEVKRRTKNNQKYGRDIVEIILAQKVKIIKKKTTYKSSCNKPPEK